MKSKKIIKNKTMQKIKLYKFNELSKNSKVFAIFDEAQAIIEMNDTKKEEKKVKRKNLSFVKSHQYLISLVYFNHIKGKEEEIFGSSLFKKDGTLIKEEIRKKMKINFKKALIELKNNFDNVRIECLERRDFMNIIFDIREIDKDFQFFIGRDNVCTLSVYTENCRNNCEAFLIKGKPFKECIKIVKEFKELIKRGKNA